MNVSSVVRPSDTLVNSEYMKAFTLVRNPTDVSNVGKPSIILVNSKDTNEHIVVFMIVNVVVKLSVLPSACSCMKELTPEKNLTNVNSVGKPSDVSALF